jgi:hypothetical protein
MEIAYVLYFMVVGNHTSLVWYGDTICIIFYGCGKLYLHGMVCGYHVIYTQWLRETILTWYGMEILYVLYFMVAGNHTSLV